MYAVTSTQLHPQFFFPPPTETADVKAFGLSAAKIFSLPPPLGEILYNRGITTHCALQEYLHPQLSMLPSPDTMKGMQQAVACIITTVQARKPIFIHGDYDVDGISASALLINFFKEIGIESKCYIPNRLEEQYGLSVRSINRLVAMSDNVIGGVLITVDCGISAVDEVVYAKELGLRVIITDHHEPKLVLPNAEAILNPKQKGCGFPFQMLAGVGVAFFLIMALRKAFVENGLVSGNVPNLKKYLDLVALGTVADVVPLVGVNRILVRAGLEELSAKCRLGLFSLCELSGLAERNILSEDIAFKLAPRINAAGRLGMPMISLELLSVNDREQAMQLAISLEQMNIQRKLLEQGSLAQVEEQCSDQVRAGAMGLAVYQKNCHPGILGILASRMVDRFCRPVIIFTDHISESSGVYLKGSGRSLAGVNLLQVLDCCTRWLEGFGGHAMSAGLTIKKANLMHFMRSFQQTALESSEILRQGKRIMIDYHLQDKDILSRDFARALNLLQPFGEGNPEPKFLLSGLKISRARAIKGHVRFQLQTNNLVFPGIGFHLAETIRDFQSPVDLVFQLKRAWYKGEGRDQIQALHFAPH